MSESEREEIIKDRLTDLRPLITAVSEAQDNQDAAAMERELKSIAGKTIDAGLELMKDGCLPDINTNHRQKTPFVERTLKVVSALTGVHFNDKSWCKKMLEKKNISKGCQRCGKRRKGCHWNPDTKEEVPEPDEDDLDVMAFCGRSCMSDYRISPACPKCGAHEKHEIEMKDGLGLPNPEALAMIAQAIKGRDENILEDMRTLADVHLPNLWCRGCKVQCMPRDLVAFYSPSRFAY